MSRKTALPLLLLFALISAKAAEPVAPDLAHAEALLRSGNATAARQLLEPHENAWAGHQDFDYLLGLAMLEAGQFGRASFILERVVGINPNHAAARLDLARALFAAGDYARAKIEFTAVLEYRPPVLAEQTARRYLEAIERQENAGKLRLAGYTEFALGYDSNVNAGVSGGAYYMPVLSVDLDAQAKRTRYGSVAAGAEAVLPLAPDREIFAGIDLKQRQHSHAAVDVTRGTDYYDNRSLDARIGVQQKLDARNALRLAAGIGRQTLDNSQPYRRSQSVLAEWRHAVNAGLQGAVWVLDQRNRYESVADTEFRQYGGNQLLAGANLTQSFGPDSAFVAHLGMLGGSERATDVAQGNLDGDKQLAGLRLDGQWLAQPDLHLHATLGGTRTHYALSNSLFLERRRDILWEASLGAQWRIDDTWSLRPQIAYTRSDSNIGAYDYARKDYSLTVRYDFR